MVARPERFTRLCTLPLRHFVMSGTLRCRLLHTPFSCPCFHPVLVTLLASSDMICLFAGCLCSNPGMFLLHATLRQKLYRKRRRSPVNVSSLLLLCGQTIQKEVDSSFLIMARIFTCLPSETTTRIKRVFGYFFVSSHANFAHDAFVDNKVRMARFCDSTSDLLWIRHILSLMVTFSGNWRIGSSLLLMGCYL